MNASPPDPVTHEELVSNVRYGYWFNLLCERLYGRLDFLLNLLQLVGGSAAVLSLARDGPATMAVSGVVLVIAAAIALLVQPAVKAERHRHAKGEFLALEGVCWSLTQPQLAARLAEVRRAAPVGVDTLAMPAYNATVRAIGRAGDVQRVSWLQRVVAAFA